MAGASDRGAAPILLATDFSDDSAAAFAWAVDAALAFRAPLHVVHVVHDPLDHPGTYAEGTGLPLEKAEVVAREMLDAWIERMLAEQRSAGSPPKVASSLVVGLPETRIREVADRLGARMIVLGGRGQTGLSEILLGSRAEHVVRLATVPVTIVRAAPADDAGSGASAGDA